ncbi:MAG: response regulator [Lachnospiraceae bacterium]|nr:response regulator [Lachnospiraceae bacterium]
MNCKLNRIIGEKISGMGLVEFNLNLFLAMVVMESIIILPIVLLFSNLDRMAAPILLIILGCGLLLIWNLRYRKHNLTAILTLVILDGIAIPMILRISSSAYCIAIMWFVASMIIIYSVFESFMFLPVLSLFIFEYCYLYSDVFFSKGNDVYHISENFHFSDLAISFVGTAFFIIMLIYIQEKFYLHQQWKIKRSSRKIERAGAAKRQFLKNMSYEIRTPMNSIINLSEIMLKGEQDDETRSSINTIRSAAYDLLAIIDDVLTYARIDAGDMHLIKSSYSFEKLIKGIIRTISEELQKKKLNLDMKIDGNIPKELLGDSVTIRQIFLYLLFISIDFTASGRIVLEVRCEKDTESGIATFYCMVADTGKGLSQIDIQSLFGMYETYDSRQSSNLKGVGLKFTICKELLAMMQGDIKVESIEGIGLSTTFTFRQEIVDASPMIRLENEKKPSVLIYADNDISIAKWQDIMETFGVRPVYSRNYYGFNHAIQEKHFDFIFVPDTVYENLSNIISLYQCQEYTYVTSGYDAVYGDYDKCRLIYRPFSCITVSMVLNNRWNKEDYKKSALEETFTARNARVLVVDDNAVNLKVAAGIFSKYGIDIAVATSGQDGIRKLENEKYDLVLMDMVMPDLGGDEVLRLIRAKEDHYYKELPFVALTAQNGANVREEMLELGFQEYLAKPVKRRYLEKCLLEFLPEGLIEHVKAKDDRDGQGNNKSISKNGEKKPESGLNKDKGLLNIGFNQEAYAAILSTYYVEGMKYLELLPNLLEVGDIQLFTTDVHGIKSSSAAIGAMEVSALFKELEFAGKAGDTDTINRQFDSCLEKFREILGEVKEYLISIGSFNEADTEQNTEEKEAEELTTQILQNLKTELDKMNLKVTDKLVPEMASRNFGADVNARMRKLKEAYDMFDFHQVKVILNEMIVGRTDENEN